MIIAPIGRVTVTESTTPASTRAPGRGGASWRERRAERLGERRVRLRPRRWRLAQALRDQRGESWWNVAASGSWRRRRFVQRACNQFRQVGLFKWRPAGEEVVEGCAHRVDVRPDVERLATQLLRGANCGVP